MSMAKSAHSEAKGSGGVDSAGESEGTGLAVISVADGKQSIEKVGMIGVASGSGMESLGREQQAVLELLLEGKSVAETARLAAIGRTTIYRWMKSDPAFMAAYNRWHDEMNESCRSRLLMLTDSA